LRFKGNGKPLKVASRLACGAPGQTEEIVGPDALRLRAQVWLLSGLSHDPHRDALPRAWVEHMKGVRSRSFDLLDDLFPREMPTLEVVADVCDVLVAAIPVGLRYTGDSIHWQDVVPPAL
jgi:hypothetical protein